MALSNPTCFQLRVMKEEITASLKFLALGTAALGPMLPSRVGFRAIRVAVDTESFSSPPLVSALSRSDQTEEITIQPSSVIEGDDVALTCQAPRYLYTALEWLDSSNRTVASNVSGLQLGNHSVSLSLRLGNVSPHSTRGYKCLARHFQGRAELKEAALTVDGRPHRTPARSQPRPHQATAQPQHRRSCVFHCSAKAALADPESDKPGGERQQHPEVGVLRPGGPPPKHHLEQKRHSAETKPR